ncbi:MAG TPA: hypothetical protein VGD40_07585 [Chryseosolibacter sp.]
MKYDNNIHFDIVDFKLAAIRVDVELVSNKPGRRSNPIPTGPEEEDDEPAKPGKTDPAKKKKKKSIYEVTY